MIQTENIIESTAVVLAADYALSNVIAAFAQSDNIKWLEKVNIKKEETDND